MKFLSFVASLLIVYLVADSSSSLANTDVYQGLFKVVIHVHSVFR